VIVRVFIGGAGAEAGAREDVDPPRVSNEPRYPEKYSAQGIRIGVNYIIYAFAGGGLPVNIPGTSANLYAPSSVAIDKAGNIFFADLYTVLRLDATTGVLTLVAGTGIAGFSGDNGLATNAQLNHPQGIVVDTAGNIYVADSGNYRIRKISNGVITTVAGSGIGNACCFSGDNGPATSAQIDQPYGVAVDSAGNLYIADTHNNRVRKVANGVITTVAGNGGPGGFGGDGGAATSAQLFQSGRHRLGLRRQSLHRRHFQQPRP
jgi:hypothetical protein